MDAHTLDKVEFDRIRKLLADHASCGLGKRMAEKVEPAARADLLERWLDQVREMIDAGATIDLPPFGGVHDIRGAVKAAVPPHVLEPDDFTVVAETLHATHGIVNWAASLPPDARRLRELCSTIGDFKSIGDAIRRVVADNGEVRDDASGKLHKIRVDIGNARIAIRQVIDRLIREKNVTRWLRYPNATFHDDRLVLPLAAEHRGRVPGIVHRTSDSGGTLFVEPAEAVELNNRIIDRKAKEQAEISRLLWQLTHQIHLNAREILDTLHGLAVLDFIAAKVRFARTYDLTCPTLSSDGKLALRRARHPLLLEMQKEAARRSERTEVVPIDVRLGDDFDVLIVTGPNTGGKTVTLKTVALICAMAQAGLPVPAADGSTVPVFNDVLVDIGDEQSLQQSLSTFSAHLKRLMVMLERADGKTLVLIDELGAGTDPEEGAAIGQAIVRELLARRCPTLITTHLGVLKSLGYTEPRVENGCVEFDVETLRPTYRLRIGEPGNSNAINIAAKLGLPPDIIEAARAHLTGSHQQLARAIRGTLDSRRAAEHAREEAEAARERALQDQQAAERERAALRQKQAAFDRWVQAIATLKPGDTVHVRRFDRTGRIIRVKLQKQTALVNVGNAEIEVALKDITPIAG